MRRRSASSVTRSCERNGESRNRASTAGIMQLGPFSLLPEQRRLRRPSHLTEVSVAGPRFHKPEVGCRFVENFKAQRLESLEVLPKSRPDPLPARPGSGGFGRCRAHLAVRGRSPGCPPARRGDQLWDGAEPAGPWRRGSRHRRRRRAHRQQARRTVRGKDRKSTRLNSSHLGISYAVFCLKKKNKKKTRYNQT